jgi:L-2-hydroxyglutarate oxidase LhgO
MLHIASIAFYYRLEVAASCYSEVWFNELRGLRVQGLTSAAKFLKEVLQELWKLQIIAFVTH